MNGHNEREIVEWGYWTAKFLFDMSGEIHRNEELENSVFVNFLRRNHFAENTTFVLDNQAAILMTAYVLLVYPKELLEQFDYNSLPNDLQQNFIFTVPTPPDKLDNETFIRRTRNAVAHANIELTLGENAHFRLWNTTNRQEINFDVIIDKQNFVEFLARLGGIFLRYVRNNYN